MFSLFLIYTPGKYLRFSFTCFSAEQKDEDIFTAEALHRKISLLPSDRPVQTFVAVTWTGKLN